MDIGNIVKAKRKELGLTQKVLAKDAEISNTFLCDIERNRVQPSLKTLMKICKSLKIEDINIFLNNNYVKTEK